MFFLRWWFKESDNFVRVPLDTQGTLFASPMPWGPYDKSNTVIRYYRRNGIDTVVALVTDEEIRRKCKKKDLMDEYRQLDIEPVHFPIPDLTSPSCEQVTELVDDMARRLEHRRRIAIHCNAGVGRTGVIVGCVVQRVNGCSGDEALELVKQNMHINMTTSQCRFVRNWERAPDAAEPVVGEG